MINKITHLLYKNGITNVCISPGLRNTIISLSFIKYGKFNCYSIIDERSAGYFALGMALKNKTASVLICTSGTAIANYFPAIIESSQSKIPLIIITADRPENLINTGENQTINQNNIYGDYVRKSIDFNENDNIINEINDSLKYIKNDIGRVTTGPIHLNIHLNEFLNFYKNEKYNKIPSLIEKQFKKNKLDYSWTQLPFKDTFNIHNYQNPIIIIGRLNYQLDLKLINKLSAHLKAPILADPLSQIRFNNNNVLSFYDHYIINNQINPDLIIRIGQKPISKNLCKQLEKWQKKLFNKLGFSSILIDESGKFNDDALTIAKIDYRRFINFIIKNTKKNTNSELYNYMHSLDKKMASLIEKENEWSEMKIAKSCLLSVNNNENFVIGNSMPIRYIDMLGQSNNHNHINTYSNRGASGIDGVIATALGIAIKSNQKTTLLIGDLSFIYDQSSLLIAQKLKINLTIVIINNNGGGIFSLLPVSKKFNKSTFNQYWTTSHDLDFKKIAYLYDFKYQKVVSQKQLNTALIQSNNNIGINIIDTQIDIEKNKKELLKIKKRIKKRIAQ